MRPISHRRQSFLVREPIVVKPALLVREMLQAVPLATRLRVDTHFIVQGARSAQNWPEIFDGVLDFLPEENGELGAFVVAPIELDVLAGPDLLFCAQDDGGC